MRQGDQIIIAASGPGAAEALQAFKTLADQHFGDADESAPTAASPREELVPAASGSRALSIPPTSAPWARNMCTPV